MTSQPTPGGDNVSPYLRIKLRDAPKPRIRELQEQPKDADSEAAPSGASREVPPLARPGIKI